MVHLNANRLIYRVLFGLLPAVFAWSATPIDLRQNPAVVSQFLSSKISAGVNANPSFKFISKYTDLQKTEHKRLQQMYHGYPVWGADIVVHSTKKANFSSLKGLSVHASGVIYQDLNQELEQNPAENIIKEQETQALNEALRLNNEAIANVSQLIKSKANRIVFVDPQNKAHWAYYIEVLATNNGALAQTSYIIDANTHELYSSWNNLHTISEEKLDFVKGGGYGGNKKLGYKTYEDIMPPLSSFNITRDSKEKLCFLQGNATKYPSSQMFFVINNGANFLDSFTSEPVKYSCPDQDAEHSGLYWNNDFNATADNDAFYHANVTDNMYLTWFGVFPVTKPGIPDEEGFSDLLPIQVYTHLKMDNAAWLGVIKSIFLGDGTETSEFEPFTSLDIVAHELSHGFTEQHANLIYKNQSGGLNESFSDMAAVAASYYLTGESTWTIGADISETPLRYIDNPRRDCVGKSPYSNVGGYKIRQCSIDHIKDFQENMDGITLTDVHFSSGIFNKAFYLMAQGWGGDKHQGTQKAFNVMVQANRGYWTPNTSFQDAACGVMEATHDYGYDENVVVKAMSAVGIDVNKC